MGRPAKSDRNAEWIARYARGETFQAIATSAGVTRQAVHEVVRRHSGVRRGCPVCNGIGGG